MVGSKCPECGFASPIFYGNYYCPRCKSVFSPEQWKQRLHPDHTGTRPHHASEPETEPTPHSASTTQTLFRCPRCQAKVPPWALYCAECQYRFAGGKA